MEGAPRASFEKTLIEEQVRIAAGSPLRIGAPGAWLVAVAIVRLLDDGPVVRALLPLAVLYEVYSVVVWVARRRMPRPLRVLYTTPFIDVPFAGLVAYVRAGDGRFRSTPRRSAAWRISVQ